MADVDYWGSMLRALCSGVEKLLDLELARSTKKEDYDTAKYLHAAAETLRLAREGLDSSP